MKQSSKATLVCIIYINTGSTFLSLMALFSAFQVTVKANYQETFCSNIKDVQFHLKTSN
jgi:hypothetical protein